MNDDDRLWLDTLAGRRTDGTTSAEREAAAFRRGVLERTMVGAAPPPEPHRADALIERARRAGLLREGRDAGPRWFQGWRGVAAALMIGAAAIGIGVLTAPPPREETVRSIRPHVVVLQTDDPEALAAEIVDELIAAGIDAVGYERLHGRGIDAELPQPIPDAARQVLARYGVPIPDDGVLEIEIDPRP